MKLITSGATPFGRMVEVTAHELGLHEDIAIERVKLSPGTAAPDFLAINPLRKIPVLVVDDQRIVDSTVICVYLAARVGDTSLFARGTGDEHRRMSEAMLAKGLTETALALRQETQVRPRETLWQPLADDLSSRLTATLAHFEAAPPAHAGRISIVTVLLGVGLEYLDFRFPHLDWRRDHPALAAWHEPIGARPSFRATQPVG